MEAEILPNLDVSCLLGKVTLRHRFLDRHAREIFAYHKAREEHPMRTLSALGFAAGIACFAAGCATSSRSQPQQVKEIEPGTYSVGVNRSDKTLFSSNDKNTIDEAVDKAGEYCHSKGQNLSVKTAAGNSIVFACVQGDPKHQ